jgi:hypothetical protein
MHTNHQPRIAYRSIASRAILWTLLFLIFGVGGDYLAREFGLEHDLLYLNDVISAMFIGLLIIIYERRRLKRIQEKLEIIELMNHHVRNALQLIAFSPHAHQREENLALIQQAVERIEWALREILPGGDLNEIHKKDRERVA